MTAAPSESGGQSGPARLPAMAIAIGLALLYYLAARLGLLLAFEATNASPIWPPTGLAIAALYSLGHRYWPSITIGAFLANFAVFSANHVAAGLEATVVSGAIALGNTAEALAGSLFLRRLVRSGDPFSHTGNVFVFAISVAAAALISALVGTESLMIGHLAPASARTDITLSWWLGDFGGAVVLFPALLCWAGKPRARVDMRQIAELAVTSVLLVALVHWIFDGSLDPGHGDRLALMLIFPLQAWTAFRFGRRGVALASLILATGAVVGTVHRHGPFTAGPLNDSLILLVSFVALASITGLVLAADLQERIQSSGPSASWRMLWPSWPLLLVALCLTVLSWHLMSRDTERRAHEAFRHRGEELRATLVDRIHDYVNLLHGAAGLVSGSRAMNHERWAGYIGNLQLEVNLPGVLGIGFAPSITRNDAGSLLDRMRGEGFADFRVWPDGTSDTMTPIIYIEPFSGRNLRAFGFDMYSDPTRRQAMDLARDSGRATMSGKVRLVQESGPDAQEGALLYLPVFRGPGDPVSIAERRSRLMGFVYAAFRSGDLIGGALGEQLGPLWLSIHDGRATDAGSTFYSNASGSGSPGFERELAVDVGNHQWTLQFLASPAFEAGVDRQKAQLVLISGSVISLLLFTLVRSLSLVSQRAMRIADERAAALRDSEAATTALAESARDGIVIVDENGHIVSWNAGASEIFGYSAQQAIALSLQQLVPAELRERVDDILARLRQGAPGAALKRTIDVDGLTRAGQRVPLEISLSSWRTTAGPLFGGIIRDISERERNTAFLRGMFNEAPDAIVVVDETGHIRHANSRASALFGYGLDALIGMPVAMLVPMEMKARHEHAHVDFFRHPARRTMGSGRDLRAVRADGDEIPVDIALTPLRLKDGNLVVATISDITELKRNQEALRRSEERLRLLIDGVSEYAILMLDPDGRVVSWNSGAERIKGYRADEIIGEHFSRFYTEADRARRHPQEVLARAAERGHYNEEGWRIRKDGSLFWASVSIAALREADGRLRGFSKVTRDMTAWRSAEQALSEMSRRLAIATSAAGIGAWDWNSRTRVLTWDDPMFSMFDVERDISGNTYEVWRSRIVEEDVDAVEEALRRTVETGSPFNAEFRIRHRNGRVHYIKASAVVLADEAGRPEVVAGVNWDITELREAENALRASEERFRSALANAPIGMAVISLDGHWQEVNRALCEFLGYDRQELMKQEAGQVCHPEDLQAGQAFLDALLQGERRSFQVERRYFRRDRRIIWGRLTTSLVRDASGNPLYFISQIEDITEQRSSREALRATLALQTAILGAADLSIIATTPDGLITLFNRAAERMLQYRADEMIGLQTPAIIHVPEEVESRATALGAELGYRVETGFETFVAKARTGVADENQWTYVRKDGSRFPVILSVTAIRDDEGNIFGFMGIASDITEREQKNRAIREALHEKETLLKEVYHRVKNNLQVITSLFNLQARTLPAGAARDALRQGAERVRAMSLVHEKLYQSSSLSSINIEEYVTALCRDLVSAGGADVRGVRLITEIEPIQIGLETAVPLGLLMNELISNSLKHGFPAGGGGEIRIVLKRLDGLTGLLEICDTGAGFPESALDGQSSSLGLKLIETLSRQLNGSLTLSNDSGACARMRFRLTEPVQAKHD